MPEPRDIPELSDADRLPDFPRPFGAAPQRDKSQQISSHLDIQDAFYRGQRLGLEQGRGPMVIVLAILVGLAAGIVIGLLLPW